MNSLIVILAITFVLFPSCKRKHYFLILEENRKEQVMERLIEMSVMDPNRPITED